MTIWLYLARTVLEKLVKVFRLLEVDNRLFVPTNTHNFAMNQINDKFDDWGGEGM